MITIKAPSEMTGQEIADYLEKSAADVVRLHEHFNEPLDVAAKFQIDALREAGRRLRFFGSVSRASDAHPSERPFG